MWKNQTLRLILKLQGKLVVDELIKNQFYVTLKVSDYFSMR